MLSPPAHPLTAAAAPQQMRRHDLPRRAGAGFKPCHFAAIMSDPHAPAFFEVHAENYLGEGGGALARLAALRERFALSVHGVGLSIGGAEPLDRDHLRRLRTLCDRFQPESFSEHLAWSSHGGAYFNDLLPLPYTEATLRRVADHVAQAQEALGRVILIENPATYIRFAVSDIPEPEFLAELARRSGCRLLLDINNVVVASANHDSDPSAYLAAFPLALVDEIHLAGHDVAQGESPALLIDAHGSPVDRTVWALYERVITKIGPCATLIEWDHDVPDWATLHAEASKADAILTRHERSAARGAR